MGCGRNAAFQEKTHTQLCFVSFSPVRLWLRSLLFMVFFVVVPPCCGGFGCSCLCRKNIGCCCCWWWWWRSCCVVGWWLSKRKIVKLVNQEKLTKQRLQRKKHWRPDQIETVIKSELSQLRHVSHCRQWVQVRRFRKNNLQPKSWYSLCTVPAVLWANASRFPHCLNFRGFVAQLYGSQKMKPITKKTAPQQFVKAFFLHLKRKINFK